MTTPTNKQIADELGPCPFCGGAPEVSTADDSGDDWYRVECLCGAMVGGSHVYDFAVANWNRRAALREEGGERGELEQFAFAEMSGAVYEYVRLRNRTDTLSMESRMHRANAAANAWANGDLGALERLRSQAAVPASDGGLQEGPPSTPFVALNEFVGATSCPACDDDGGPCALCNQAFSNATQTQDERVGGDAVAHGNVLNERMGDCQQSMTTRTTGAGEPETASTADLSKAPAPESSQPYGRAKCVKCGKPIRGVAQTYVEHDDGSVCPIGIERPSDSKPSEALALLKERENEPMTPLDDVLHTSRNTPESGNSEPAESDVELVNEFAGAVAITIDNAERGLIGHLEYSQEEIVARAKLLSRLSESRQGVSDPTTSALVRAALDFYSDFWTRGKLLEAVADYYNAHPDVDADEPGLAGPIPPIEQVSE